MNYNTGLTQTTSNFFSVNPEKASPTFENDQSDKSKLKEERPGFSSVILKTIEEELKVNGKKVKPDPELIKITKKMEEELNSIPSATIEGKNKSQINDKDIEPMAKICLKYAFPIVKILEKSEISNNPKNGIILDKDNLDTISKRVHDIANGPSDNMELVMLQLMIMIMLVALETLKKNCMDLELKDKSQMRRCELMLASADEKAKGGYIDSGCKIFGGLLGAVCSSYGMAKGNELGSIAGHASSDVSGLGGIASQNDYKQSNYDNAFAQNATDMVQSADTMFQNNQKIVIDLLTTLLQFMKEMMPLLSRLLHGGSFVAGG
ncbi:type III secretion system protein [Candidatus Hamiltonella defensa]|uniref:type III secretion system protein n=1 Tax=Candidatus Williamhamiltonella defendens TaxID=138072 RepID=UPI0015838A47|nr:type III secretion system protein [Candidatus Hamiltonella defensa]